MKKFIAFTKVDEEKRMVWGLASDETIDAEDEVVDYEATKEAVAEWLEWSNIREMHGPTAVGVATEVTLDDATKSLWLGVKVIDDQAWLKCKTGVYKGLSIGGKALKKIQEMINGRTVRRVVKYILTEISLVDRPANPSARFSLVKREGGVMPEEEMAAEEVTNKMEGEEQAEAQAEAEAEAEAKAEGATEQQAQGAAATEEAKAEGEAEEAKAMTAEMVKSLVIEMLKELGLVREEGQEQPLAQAAEVKGLRKSLTGLAAKADLQKVSGDVAKVSGNLTKVVGDLVKVATAIDGLEERLEKVEQLPQGTGPVLREIGAFGVTDQTEAVLKAVMADTTDPVVKQAIGQRLTEMQIKQAHQQPKK